VCLVCVHMFKRLHLRSGRIHFTQVLDAMPPAHGHQKLRGIYKSWSVPNFTVKHLLNDVTRQNKAKNAL
jgi:hypothetical protein